MESSKEFQPGTLWQMITARSRTALQCGALHPIATNVSTIEDGGVPFQVRTVSSLRRKDAERSRAPRPTERRNPFLPYEEALFVTDISRTHLCLLNKFNVIDHHALIITRAFERQENPLTEADFDALSRCVAEFDALGFYNGGATAGATQPHKHLQLVPLPLTADCAIPIERLLASAPALPGLTRVPRLPFAHAFAWLQTSGASPVRSGRQMHLLYRAMLEHTGLDRGPDPAPYNLLVTRRFMLLIPRSQERFEAVSVNSLGFAGSFFVASEERAEVIRRAGPLAVLKHVTYPLTG